MEGDTLKISQMPQASEIDDSTVLAGVSNGVNFKFPASLIKGTVLKPAEFDSAWNG